VSDGYSFLHQIKFTLDRFHFRKLLQLLEKPEIDVLDIGGGIGHLASQVKRSATTNKKINTWVCDIDDSARDMASKSGHGFYLGTFEEVEFERKFDFILAYNILEHVPDPYQFLEKIMSSLCTGGIAIIQTPNWNSIDARLFRKYYWGGLHAPRHFFLYSKSSLRKSVEKIGFTIKSHKNIPAGPFWTYSLFASLSKRTDNPLKIPPYSRKFHNFFVGFFSAVDVLRGWTSETSQQLLVIQKNNSNI
jgi:2-polyprenyl-3-methyl-5-hydroxy-6-metoxy-1,4-benzoquinol methylase